MQAFVADQSTSFGSVVIDTGITIVASLDLLPGSWAIFATVALGTATSVLGTTVVEVMFVIDGNPYGTAVKSDFTVADTGGFISGFRVVPLTTGLAIDAPKTLQVGCVATRGSTVASQPTTITAIQVGSVTRHN
jgi:hypothetical protein